MENKTSDIQKFDFHQVQINEEETTTYNDYDSVRYT